MGLGRVQLMAGQQKLWYKACQQCNKTIKDTITWDFACNSCGLKALGQPRCHVGVYLSGEDAALPTTLFSLAAEKLIMYSAGDLKAAHEKNASLTREIDLSIRNKEVVCLLKSLERKFQGNSVRTYPVLKMYLKSELSRAEDEETTKELFTPTLKNTLDEIDSDPTGVPHKVTSSAAKRPLSFDEPGSHSNSASSGEKVTEVTKDKQVAATVAEISHDAPTTVLPTDDGSEKSSCLQSPIKRTKK